MDIGDDARKEAKQSEFPPKGLAGFALRVTEVVQ